MPNKHHHIVEPGGTVRLYAYRNITQARAHQRLIDGRWILTVGHGAPCKHCAALRAMDERRVTS